MTFTPPRCPNQDCEQHRAPTPRFFVRNGFYHPHCRREPVPRFRCRTCRRGFSVQTFRYDRGDRRPECNRPLFQLLTSGVGLRQSGRLLKLGIASVVQKLRKLARTCEHLQKNLCPELPPGRTFLLDEEETYEGASIRPLTLPVLIDRETWFVVATAVGPIRRLAAAGCERRERQRRDESARGTRPDQSRDCVRAVLGRLAELVPKGPLRLQTDEKSSYATLIREVFGDRAIHETTAGSDPRTTRNPLFPINTTLAMSRDNNGRLRRKSWLVTKLAPYLQRQLLLFAVYRNYVRKRFNRDADGVTAGLLLGLVPRALSVVEVLRWRQDWSVRSIHPMSFGAETAIADSLQLSA
jgi:transposase-like protein